MHPWRATGLEWQTTSPPPMHNFDLAPQVNGPPYAYAEQPAPENAPAREATS
jgi:cytochrome c oxidase subunit 1